MDALLAIVSTFVLVTIRIATALRLIPFFGGAPIPTIPWIALSTALALLLSPKAAPLTEVSLDNALFVALGLKEIFIGLLIGVCVRFSFLILEVVGKIAHLSTLIIPYEGESDPFSKFYILLGSAVFLLIDGHHGLIQSLLTTLHCVPPHLLPGAGGLFTDALSDKVITLFCSAMATGVLVAGPIFAATIVTELVLGSLSRILHGIADATAHGFRVLAVQLVLIASLIFVVSSAVEFLQQGLQAMALCGR